MRRPAVSNLPAAQLWRIPRVQYERMVDAGAFGPDDRVELLDGVLIAHEPQGSRHPLSEPEPDLVVVRGGPRDYRDAHPSSSPSGWKYRSVKLLKAGATVSPLSAPRRRIRIVDLLP